MSNSSNRLRNKRKSSGGLAIRKKHLLPIGLGVLGLIVLGVGAIVLLGGNSSGGTPNLVVEQEVFDYGDVPFNEPITTVFVIRNTGDAPLKIQGQPQVVLKDGC